MLVARFTSLAPSATLSEMMLEAAPRDHLPRRATATDGEVREVATSLDLAFWVMDFAFVCDCVCVFVCLCDDSGIFEVSLGCVGWGIQDPATDSCLLGRSSRAVVRAETT